MKSYDPMDMKHLPKLGSQPTRSRKGHWVVGDVGDVRYEDATLKDYKTPSQRRSKEIRNKRLLKRIKLASQPSQLSKYTKIANVQEQKANIAKSKQIQRQSAFNPFRALGIVSPSGTRQHSKPIKYTGEK